MRYIAFVAALIAALTLAPPAAAANDWAWPVRGDVVTPYKNGDDPYASGQHRGIDIAAPVGTRVGAAVAGRVTFAGVAGSSGLIVNVRTGDGRYDVSYLHLSTAAVHEGDGVGRGQPIGAVGTSGRRSVEQAHLHLGVREAGDRHAYLDPLDFLPPLAPPVAEPPSAVPVGAPDPVVAPPATALAPARAPAAVTTDALAPLPGGALVATLAGQGDAAAGPESSAAPSAGSAGSAGSGAAAPHGSANTGSAPAANSGSTPARHPGSSSAPTTAHHGSAPARHHGSARGPAARDVAGTRDHALRATSAMRAHGAGGHRAISRADLRTPSRNSAAAARSPAPEASPRFAGSDRRAASPSTDDGGPNAGWIAAVVGLVAAATCLGRPQAAHRAARTGRGAVGAVLRPLAGRG